MKRFKHAFLDLCDDNSDGSNKDSEVMFMVLICLIAFVSMTIDMW